MANRIIVVIPNWNGIDLIRECLRSLEAQTLAHHVIVVDNGSVDGSDEVVAREFPKVELKRFPNNAGFAGGVNRGIRPALEAGADYIALLNNDAEAEPEWLERLVAAAEADERIGAVAAKIATADGQRLDSTGDFYSTWGFAFPRGRGEVDHGQYDEPEQRDIFAASGGASLYRAAMLREVGLFDERFFAYFEDVDVSFRAQLAGWRVRYEPAAVVRHATSSTSSRIDVKGQAVLTSKHKRNEESSSRAPEPTLDGHPRPSAFARYHTVKNFAYVYTKNMPGALYWRYLPRYLASEGMMFASDLKRGLWRQNLRAQATVLGHLPGILADRRRIQRVRRVTPAEIDRRLVHALPPLQRLRFERLGLLKRQPTKPNRSSQ